jgi:hypothetical protein
MRNKDNAKSRNDTKCHRCGDYSHFAKYCHAPKHLVALYQKSLKDAKSVGELNKICVTLQSCFWDYSRSGLFQPNSKRN